MTKKIFHSILLVAGAVLLASLFVITGALYEYFGIIQKKQLKDELALRQYQWNSRAATF